MLEIAWLYIQQEPMAQYELNYNTRLKPAEILVDQKSHKVIRKAEIL